MEILRIEGLVKKYGDKTAVDNISLSIEAGEICAFIGHNGAGKTTTLKAAAGILPYNAGKVSICGLDMAKEPLQAKAKMAYLPDNPDLYDFLSGIRYLNFIADVYGLSSEKRGARIKELAEIYDLTKDLAQPIGAYSHGMKQKLALISAFMRDPQLIMMDEPFVGLDPMAAHHTKELMKQLCQNGGAIFFSTHVLEVAEKLCDKVAIVKDGKLLVSGSMEQVKGDASLESVFFDLAAEGNGEEQ